MDICSTDNSQSSCLFDDTLFSGELDPLQLDDKLLGTNQIDSLHALPTGSAIYGLDGNDVITGNESNDILFGNNGNDSIDGAAGSDLINGGSQKDTLNGGNENDRLVGGADDDLLKGDEGDDFLSGQSGHDQLEGNAGNDFLYGGANIDSIFGGQGDDYLADYDGGDLLSGGDGADEFWVGSPIAEEATQIEDFESGTDRIKILRLGASFDGLTIRDSEAGAVISDRANPIAVVKGVSAAELSSEDFIFGDPQLAEELENSSTEAIVGTLIPGIASMVVLPDGTVWHGAEGFSDLETKEPLDPDQLLPINSTSKLFPGTITLQLIEEGQIGLDDPLGEYLPEVASQIPGAENITIRQLLNHTSGLNDGAIELFAINEPENRAELIANPDTPEVLRDFLIKLGDEAVQPSSLEDPEFIERFSLTPEKLEELNSSVEELFSNPANYPDTEFTLKDLVELSYGQPLLFEPGTEYSYSDLNQDILSLVIESVTGTLYINQLQERIFEPLGMDNTFYAPQENLSDGFPTLYSDSDNDGQTDTGFIDSVESSAVYYSLFGYAAGGIFSTTSDMTRFVQALYRGEIVTPSTINQATSNGNNDGDLFDYGFSTEYRDDPNFGRIWGHAGGGAVSSGRSAFFPDLDASVVTMVNGGDRLEIDGESIEVSPETQFLFDTAQNIAN